MLVPNLDFGVGAKFEQDICSNLSYLELPNSCSIYLKMLNVMVFFQKF